MKIIDESIFEALVRMKVKYGSASELARRLELSRSHISLLMHRRVNYFEDKTWQRIEPLVSQFIELKPRTIEAVKPDMTGSFVPIVSLAGAASVRPGLMPILDCVQEHAEDQAYFPQARTGDFVIQVSGTSMSPWYPDGTLLLVRPSYDIPNGKRVIAVLDSGDILFKIIAQKGDKFCLFSIDDDGKDFIFDRPNVPIRYICRVIASIRDEDALDDAMSGAHVCHRWQNKLETL